MIERVRAIIIKNKKVLLATEGDGRYTLPGGHQEGKETRKQTLERELLEELNLKLKSMKFIWSMKYNNREDKRERKSYYLCTIEGKPRPNNEVTGYLWCNFKECARFYRDREKEMKNIFETLRKQNII